MKIPSLLATALLFGAALTPTSASADWTTYHLDNARTGNDQSEPITHSVSDLWGPATVDADVYAEPLTFGSALIVATENNSIYAFDQAAGTLLWQVNLAASVPGNQLTCGNISPVGVTGTPVIDSTAGVLYAVALTWDGTNQSSVHHELYAINLNNKGATLWHETIAPAAHAGLPGFDPLIQGQRGALALNGGTVYIPFGGRWGDCGDYRGWIVGAPASGVSTSIPSYETPSSAAGSGFWASGGEAFDGSGNVYATSGNSNCTSPCTDVSESVIKIKPDLSAALDWFTDPNWDYLNANDIDLGSIAPTFVTPSMIFQAGKYGIGYLLNAGNLGGANHMTPLASARVCPQTNDATFGSVAYAAPYVYVPCADHLEAVKVNTTSPSLTLAWSGPSVSYSTPPIIAGNLVWTIDPSGALYGLDRSSGGVVFSRNLGGAAHFATPTAFNSRLFVAAGTSVYGYGLSQWYDWESLGGTQASGPAVTTWGPGRLDVFARGTNNDLIHKWYANNSWSGWESLCGVISGSPGAVAWSPGRIDVFVKGTDNALWHRFYQNGWSSWESLGGTLASGPSVAAWSVGRLDVFARATDNTLQHSWYDGGGWHPFESLGGTLAGEPGAVSWSSGRIDVFSEGSNNALWHRFYQNGWSAWESLGGTLSAGPDVSTWGINRLDVFAKGSNGSLMHVWYNGGASWQPWEALGGQLADSPGAVSWGINRIDVFAQGTDNALWHRWFN